MSVMRHLLKEGLDKLSINYSYPEMEKLILFAGEIEKWNKRFNLVKAEGAEIITNHILDSLTALYVINEIRKETGKNLSILDVGSGAGFPGIPLAVFLTNAKIVLLERSEKRTAFLKNVVLLLELENTHVIKDDLKNIRDYYDIVCFRAFSRIADSVRYLIQVMSSRGYIIAYKGKLEGVVDEIAAINDIFKYNQVLKVNVPFLNSERHLIVSDNLIKRD